MRFRLSLVAVVIATVSNLAFAGGPTAREANLMTCMLQNGGFVLVTAEDRKVNLYFDRGSGAVFGRFEAKGLGAMLELVSTGSLVGPIDYAEIGSGYTGPNNQFCGIGLTFLSDPRLIASNQPLGYGREIQLPAIRVPGVYGGYRSVSCGNRSLGIVKCVAGPALRQVTDLKLYLNQIEGD